MDLALLACATVVAASLLRDWIRDHRSSSDSVAEVTVADAAAYARTGHMLGARGAPVVIVEFADFECPACRSFTRGALSDVRAKFPGQVSVSFRHWPLDYHPLAMPAAQAAACAAEQGRFEVMHDMLFESVQIVAQLDPANLALRAGVADTAAYVRCLASPSTASRIAADREAAKRLNGRGTPLVLVNDVMVSGAVPAERLEQLVRDALR